MMRGRARAVCGGALAALLSSAAALGQAPDGVSDRIQCAPEASPDGAVCGVETRLYVGWRVFHAQCASCHAQDALGSSFAPDLTRRLRGMDAREFFKLLDDGYLGPHDVSPPRGSNPDVARYYDELWGYLSARASGELPPGTLTRLPNAAPAPPQ